MSLPAPELLIRATNALPGVRANISTNKTSTQNHDALQDALSKAQARRLPVFLPPGRFYCDPIAITAWSGMLIAGAGAGTYSVATQLINQDTGGNALMTITPPTGTTVDNVMLRDFGLGGNANSGDGLVIGSTAASADYLIGFTVRNLISNSHGGNGIFSGGQVDQLLLDTCHTNSNAANGVAFDDTASGGARLKAEVVLLNHRSNHNTTRGLLVYSSFYTFLSINGEYSSSTKGWEVRPTTDGVIQFLGGHCENNSTYHGQIAGSGAGPVHIHGHYFLDNVSGGIADCLVLVGSANNLVTIEDVSYNLQNATAVFAHEQSNPTVRYKNVVSRTPATGYVRKLSDGSKTNILNGGPTTQRWPNAQGGDRYFDTTLGKPVFYDGSGWVDATGTTV